MSDRDSNMRHLADAVVVGALASMMALAVFGFVALVSLFF